MPKQSELLSPESLEKSILNEMITLASTNNQNVPICSSNTNEDTAPNLDTITGPMTDSKLHSQFSMDTYVFKCF